MKSAQRITANVTLLNFWKDRNLGNPSQLDRYSANNVSFLFAWLAHKLHLAPNHLSVLSGVVAAVAFGLGIFLPATELLGPLLLVIMTAQIAHLLDCADGQLARSTNQESDFGAFLDVGVDAASSVLALGGVFVLAARHYTALNDLTTSNWVLLVGFIFLVCRSARFFVWQKFSYTYQDLENSGDTLPGPVHRALIILMDHQTSLAAVLVLLVSPYLALVLFGIQTSVLLMAYVRYFFRAYRIEQSKLRSKRDIIE